MTILPTGARLYVADPLPEFDRRLVSGWSICVEPIRSWIEVRVNDGQVFEIQHQPPAVNIRQIEQEILEAQE